MKKTQFYHVQHRLLETLQKNDFTKPCIKFTVKHFVVTISNESIVLFVNIKKN